MTFPVNPDQIQTGRLREDFHEKTVDADTSTVSRCEQEIGAPGTIRTCDRLVRSQVLYPAELRAQKNSGEGRGTSGEGKCQARCRPGGEIYAIFP